MHTCGLKSCSDWPKSEAAAALASPHTHPSRPRRLPCSCRSHEWSRPLPRLTCRPDSRSDASSSFRPAVSERATPLSPTGRVPPPPLRYGHRAAAFPLAAAALTASTSPLPFLLRRSPLATSSPAACALLPHPSLPSSLRAGEAPHRAPYAPTVNPRRCRWSRVAMPCERLCHGLHACRAGRGQAGPGRGPRARCAGRGQAGPGRGPRAIGQLGHGGFGPVAFDYYFSEHIQILVNSKICVGLF
jgi:hypothetical protein